MNPNILASRASNENLPRRLLLFVKSSQGSGVVAHLLVVWLPVLVVAGPRRVAVPLDAGDVMHEPKFSLRRRSCILGATLAQRVIVETTDHLLQAAPSKEL
eukprot:CAMPEP_0183594208 /NCGR_PEP_ID=MMETSP0371-20130417/171252_1 /TAXON_ID=268820 /ORGANISM="Peridinium aciculiferum, Strain PAER-2" /LENGTH=100 /DNA_ID=CAMNT_0025805895 /DNA_START=276 /DNA_END=578 /DNA_ORIENTATION=-